MIYAARVYCIAKGEACTSSIRPEIERPKSGFECGKICVIRSPPALHKIVQTLAAVSLDLVDDAGEVSPSPKVSPVSAIVG